MKKLLFLVICFLAVGSANGAPAKSEFCEELLAPAEAPKQLAGKPFYPKDQLQKLGEGWVRIRYTVTAAGLVVNPQLDDIVGDYVFARAAAGALKSFKYAPTLVEGKPVALNRLVDYVLGIQGGGPPHRVSRAYDRASEARERNDFQKSIEILSEANEASLGFTAYARLEYGLALSYRGLGDDRRALRHLRRAAAANFELSGRSLVRETLTLLAALEARFGNPREALCAFSNLRERLPDEAVEQGLADLMTAAEQQLKGTAPIRTEAEIVESGRKEISPFWVHTILRKSFAFDAVQGAAKYHLTCPLTETEGPVLAGITVGVNQPTAVCVLRVFGDPGTKFVLEER